MKIHHELLESISPALLNYLQRNAQEMVLDKSACVLVSDILDSDNGDIHPAMNAIASLVAAELHLDGKDGKLHVAEHPVGHLVLKWLIEQNKKMQENGREGCFAKTLRICWYEEHQILGWCKSGCYYSFQTSIEY